MFNGLLWGRDGVGSGCSILVAPPLDVPELVVGRERLCRRAFAWYLEQAHPRFARPPSGVAAPALAQPLDAAEFELINHRPRP